MPRDRCWQQSQRDLENKYKKQGRVSYLASQHLGRRDPCVIVTLHTLVGKRCWKPPWIQALLLYKRYLQCHITRANTAQGKEQEALAPKGLQVYQQPLNRRHSFSELDAMTSSGELHLNITFASRWKAVFTHTGIHTWTRSQVWGGHWAPEISRALGAGMPVWDLSLHSTMGGFTPNPKGRQDNIFAGKSQISSLGINMCSETSGIKIPSQRFQRRDNV